MPVFAGETSTLTVPSCPRSRIQISTPIGSFPDWAVASRRIRTCTAVETDGDTVVARRRSTMTTYRPRYSASLTGSNQSAPDAPPMKVICTTCSSGAAPCQ